MKRKIFLLKNGEINLEKFSDILSGWNAYASWANSYNLRCKLIRLIND